MSQKNNHLFLFLFIQDFGNHDLHFSYSNFKLLQVHIDVVAGDDHDSFLWVLGALAVMKYLPRLDDLCAALLPSEILLFVNSLNDYLEE